MNKIIAIANQKEVLEKQQQPSTLRLVLSTNRRVLLIDLDPQGNATTAAGISTQNPKNLCDYYFEGAQIKECVYSSKDGFDILPCDEGLIALEVAIRNDNKQGFLSNALESFSDTHNYTIIDTPPTSTNLLLRPFSASGTLIRYNVNIIT